MVVQLVISIVIAILGFSVFFIARYMQRHS
jgi:hypothetical protein